MKEVQVLVRCIKCKAERWVRPGEVTPGDSHALFCEKDLMPMLAVRAEAREVKV